MTERLDTDGDVLKEGFYFNLYANCFMYFTGKYENGNPIVESDGLCWGFQCPPEFTRTYFRKTNKEELTQGLEQALKETKRKASWIEEKLK